MKLPWSKSRLTSKSVINQKDAPKFTAEISQPFIKDLNSRSELAKFLYTPHCFKFTTVEQPSMQLFETKKCGKSLHTQSGTEEPLNFRTASIGQPNPASEEIKKKKSFCHWCHWCQQDQAACSSSKVSPNQLGGGINGDTVILWYSAGTKWPTQFNAPNHFSHYICLLLSHKSSGNYFK